MAGLGWRPFTRERLTSADFQGYAVDQGNLWFPSAAARSAALPSPSSGMVSWLDDAKVFEDYVNGAWKRRTSAQSAGLIAGTFAATNNYALSADLTVNPGRPYRVSVRIAALLTVGASAVGSLRLFEGATQRAAFALPAVTVQGNRGAYVERAFLVTDGTPRTYKANLEVTAGSIASYTDDTNSYIQAEWTAL